MDFKRPNLRCTDHRRWKKIVQCPHCRPDYSHQDISVQTLKKQNKTKQNPLTVTVILNERNWRRHQSITWWWISSVWNWSILFFLIYFTLFNRKVSECMLLMPHWCFLVDSVGCLKNILLHGGSGSESQFGNCILPPWMWLDGPVAAEKLGVHCSTAVLTKQNNLPSLSPGSKERGHGHASSPFLWNTYTGGYGGKSMYWFSSVVFKKNKHFNVCQTFYHF